MGIIKRTSPNDNGEAAIRRETLAAVVAETQRYGFVTARVTEPVSEPPSFDRISWVNFGASVRSGRV